MKRFATLLGSFVLLGSALGGCFPTRSDKLLCAASQEGATKDGRTCEDGYWVETGGGEPDGMTVDSPDATPVMDCASMWPTKPTFIDPCNFMPEAGPTLTETGANPGYTLDTGAKTLKSPAGATVPVTLTDSEGFVVWSVEDFKVPANVMVHVVGTAPLVVVSFNNVQIDGTLDASSYSTGAQVGGVAAAVDIVGAGASATAGLCTGGTPGTKDGDNDDGDGGGAGGSYATLGAAGGKGGSGDDGQGGAANAVRAMPKLAAGCVGTVGGQKNTGSGLAGNGGGAIQLVAQNAIQVNGTGLVLAGGAGGKGGTAARAGGGGGGSGGMVGLEAQTITNNGFVGANGGGGGQGHDNNLPSAPGATGAAAANAQASGGDNGGNPRSGGAGGKGGAATLNPTTVDNGDTGQDGNQGGAGGGGGAVGFIATKGGTPTGVGKFSPTATPR